MTDGPNVVEMLTASWRRQLQKAADEQDVVAIARAYLSAWSPVHLQRIPEEFRPTAIADAADVSYWAFQLARVQEAPPVAEADAGLFGELATFFGNASARLAQLLWAARARTLATARADFLSD